MYKPRRCDACGAPMEADSRKCEYCQTCYEYIGPAVPYTHPGYQTGVLSFSTNYESTYYESTPLIGYSRYDTGADVIVIQGGRNV